MPLQNALFLFIPDSCIRGWTLAKSLPRHLFISLLTYISHDKEQIYEFYNSKLSDD